MGYTGIISRMHERRNWKKVNNEEGGNYHRRLKKDFKRFSGKTKKKSLESLRGEIVEFRRIRLCALTYLKGEERGLKENHGIQSITIEDSQWLTILDQRNILSILETYITQLYDPNNRLEKLEAECEE